MTELGRKLAVAGNEWQLLRMLCFFSKGFDVDEDVTPSIGTGTVGVRLDKDTGVPTFELGR
jgi:hypothetical protein